MVLISGDLDICFSKLVKSFARIKRRGWSPMRVYSNMSWAMSIALLHKSSNVKSNLWLFIQ